MEHPGTPALHLQLGAAECGGQGGNHGGAIRAAGGAAAGLHAHAVDAAPAGRDTAINALQCSAPNQWLHTPIAPAPFQGGVAPQRNVAPTSYCSAAELQGRPRTEAAQLLLLAAFRGHTQLLRLLLLLLTAPTAFLDTPELMPELFKEAYLVRCSLVTMRQDKPRPMLQVAACSSGCCCAWQQQLRLTAVPRPTLLLPLQVFGHQDSTASPFSMGWSPLHTAAAGGSVACATVLLEADARLAAIATMGGWRPAHVAAWHGRTDVLRLLLATTPETAQASDFDGYLPIHCAALGGRQGCVQLLVAADPASLMATTGMEKQPCTWPALASSRVMPAAAAMRQWCSSCWSCTPAQC